MEVWMWSYVEAGASCLRVHKRARGSMDLELRRSWGELFESAQASTAHSKMMQVASQTRCITRRNTSRIFDDACYVYTMTPVVIRAISAILGGPGGVCVKHRLRTHVGECEGNALHGVAGIIKQRGVPI